MMAAHRYLVQKQCRGFTLIEAILVIVITGIVGAMVSVFIKKPIDAYVDLTRRGELSDAADSALRRIGRDLQGALPNSVRVDPGGTFIEFLPVKASGRYRAEPDVSGVGDILDFESAADGSFAILGPTVAAVAGDQLVVFNLGFSGADAYVGDNRRAITSFGAAISTLTFTTTASALPYASPSKRFQIVSTPVSYVCTPVGGGAGSLRRYAGYAIQSSQPTNTAGAPLLALTGNNNALLTSFVSACTFSYSTSASVRNAVATLRLTLTSGGESVTLLHQVHVDNTP